MKSVGSSYIFVVINYIATSHSSRRCPLWVMTLELGQYGSFCWVLFSEGLHIEASFSKRQTIYEPRGVWGFCSGLSPVKVSPNSCLPASHNACENSLFFLGTEIWFQLFSYFLVKSELKCYFCRISSPLCSERAIGVILSVLLCGCKGPLGVEPHPLLSWWPPTMSGLQQHVIKILAFYRCAIT